MNDFILEYYQQIRDGRITAGRWIQLLYECLIHGIERGDFTFDKRKANRVIKFVESNVHHTEGRLAPKKIKLELWQKAMLSAIYGILDDKGNRQFREVLAVCSRKQGKSKLATAVAKVGLYGDNEYGARVFCVAPKLDQADIVYNDIWQSISLEPELLKESKHRKSDIYVASTNSSVKKIAFNAKKSDGFNPSVVICDEIASWQGDQGLKQYEVMKSAVGARTQPLVFSITTSGYINDGIYDELVKRATRFLLGESKEKRLLPFLYMIDDIEKWNDINELKKSNPNLGVSVSVDYLLEEIAIAEGSLPKKSEFLTKYACIKANSSVAWLPASVVDKARRDPLNIGDFKGTYCVAGIDLSQTRDLTCATVIVERDGILNVFARFWMPAEKVDEATERDGVPYKMYIQRGLLFTSGDNYVDYHDCENWLVELVRDYQIYPLQVGYDRYSAQYLIQDLQAQGFHTDDVYQGENLWGVIQELQGLLEDGKINIGDNDLLKVHLLDSAIKLSAERGRGRLVKVHPRAHIDGVASLLCGLTVRQKYYGEIGEQLKNGTV